MIRALVVEAAGNLWGSERALLDLLEVMPTVEVAVCCPAEKPLNRKLADSHIRTLPYYIDALHEKSRWQRLRAAIGVLRACFAFRPDVIYLNQTGSYRVVLPAAILFNLKIVAHIRIFEDAAYLARRGPHAHRLGGLIAISEAVESEIRRFPELDAISLNLIYDAYAPSPPKSPPAARIPSRLAYVGRLVPVKGPDILVRAIALLGARNHMVECMILGSGETDYVDQLKRMSPMGSAASIKWLGFSDNVIPLLRTSSVLAFPSHREPLGRAIFEAWDAGVIPVVFSGSGGSAEIVSSSNGGVLYQEQEPESLAAALQVALELNDEQRTRLINNGRSWMADNCNPSRYGSVISAILGNVCASQDLP